MKKRRIINLMHPPEDITEEELWELWGNPTDEELEKMRKELDKHKGVYPVDGPKPPFYRKKVGDNEDDE